MCVDQTYRLLVLWMGSYTLFPGAVSSGTPPA